jgi:hypothetical protein
MRGSLAGWVLAAVFVAGCAGTTDLYEFRLTSLATQPRAVPGVYMRGTRPPSADFIELALLQARSNESFPSAVAALQKQAARIGADALIDVRGDWGSYETTVLGTAIVWVRQSPESSIPKPR